MLLGDGYGNSFVDRIWTHRGSSGEAVNAGSGSRRLDRHDSAGYWRRGHRRNPEYDIGIWSDWRLRPAQPAGRHRRLTGLVVWVSIPDGSIDGLADTREHWADCEEIVREMVQFTLHGRLRA